MLAIGFGNIRHGSLTQYSPNLIGKKNCDDWTDQEQDDVLARKMPAHEIWSGNVRDRYVRERRREEVLSTTCLVFMNRTCW